jgi:hypothetical protein
MTFSAPLSIPMSCDLGHGCQTPTLFWFVQHDSDFACRNQAMKTHYRKSEIRNELGQGGVTAVPRRGRERPRFMRTSVRPNLRRLVGLACWVTPAHAVWIYLMNCPGIRPEKVKAN